MKLDDQVWLLGIRHHGPGCASSLKRALDDLRPDAILLEGAQELQDSWALCGDPGMVPPVAQLVYDPKDPAAAVFYPWGIFSPEWQAMQYALARGCALEMMDLPFGLELELQNQERAARAAAEDEDKDEDRHGDGDRAAQPVPPRSEEGDTEGEALQHDSPFDQLARAAGFEEGETWWDLQVEHHRHGLDLFAAIAEAMTALREQTPERPGSRDLLREAWMRRVLRAARKQHARIAVVCGAWHVPALAAAVKVKDDTARLKGLKRRKVEVVWVPYTYARFSQDSGYRAGISSPGWYEHLFRHLEAGREADALTIEWMSRIARLLRAEGFSCSSAEVIDSVRLARQLAILRGQARPALAETLDAAGAVMTQGHLGPLAIVRDQLIIADRLGQLPESIPKLPLEQDLDAWIRRLRLSRSEKAQGLELDLRKDIGLQRSVLLHRLQLLGIPWGTRTQDGGRGTFKESWSLQWQPEFAIALIDASAAGNTLLAAASRRLGERVEAERGVSGIVELLESLRLADLTNLLPAAMARLQQLAGVSSDLQDLMHALLGLVQIQRYGSVRATSAEALDHVIEGIVIRVTNGLAPACVSLDEEAAYGMLACIDKAHSAIHLLESSDYLARWKQALREVVDHSACHPVVLGRGTRLLYDLDSLDSAALAQAFRLAVSRGNEVTRSAAWIEGLLLNGALLLLHDEELFAVLDSWLGELEESEFVRALPLLRRAFSTFSSQELGQIGDRVLYGSAETLAAARVLDPHLKAHALPLLRTLLGL